MEDSDALNKLGGHPLNITDYPIRDSIGAKDKVAHYPKGKLKGTKQSAWEGGVRTPFIARLPGHFSAGVKSSEFFALYDVMPTFAEVVGYDIPDTIATYGLSLFSVLEGQKGVMKSVAVQFSNNVYGLRRGKWKYINGETHPDKKINYLLMNCTIFQ